MEDRETGRGGLAEEGDAKGVRRKRIAKAGKVRKDGRLGKEREGCWRGGPDAVVEGEREEGCRIDAAVGEEAESGHGACGGRDERAAGGRLVVE